MDGNTWIWIAIAIAAVSFGIWKPRAFLMSVLILLAIGSGLLVLLFITVIVAKLLGGGKK